jgi:hypothetical protein
MSWESCARLCAANYMMGTAGVETKTECWCSNYTGAQGPLATNQSDCMAKYDCPAGQMCGGFCRITEFALCCGEHCGQSQGLGKGMSFFVLPLSIAALVYLVAGIVINRARGQAGMRSLPNVSFWTHFCGLVASGFRFSLCIPTKDAGGDWGIRRVFQDYENL